MKTYTFLLWVLFFLLIACGKKEDTFRFPVIVDSLLNDDGTPTELYSIEEYNHPYYFGKLLDTIKVGRQIIRIPPPPPPPFQNSYTHEKWSADSLEYTKKGLEYWKVQKQIALNKSRFEQYTVSWNKKGTIINEDSIKVCFRIDTTQRINKGRELAFPVLIQNTSIDTIEIGKDDELYITLEAQTKSGKWVELKKRTRFGFSCGILPRIVLPPKEYVLTSQMMCLGGFKTKLRLKMYDNYSEEFWGMVDEKLLSD